MARPTNDPKPNGIRIRFNSATIVWLYKTASEKGITVSQLVRDIIVDAMDNKK